MLFALLHRHKSILYKELCRGPGPRRKCLYSKELCHFLHPIQYSTTMITNGQANMINIGITTCNVVILYSCAGSSGLVYIGQLHAGPVIIPIQMALRRQTLIRPVQYCTITGNRRISDMSVHLAYTRVQMPYCLEWNHVHMQSNELYILKWTMNKRYACRYMTILDNLDCTIAARTLKAGEGSMIEFRFMYQVQLSSILHDSLNCWGCVDCAMHCSLSVMWCQ